MKIGTSIGGHIWSFQDRIAKDPHHRFRSWAHCYKHFGRRVDLRKRPDADIDALHLGFYLASWGMYRGSTFLLWKDFRIHKYAVREVLRARYDFLYGLDVVSPAHQERACKAILDLAQKLRDAYRKHISLVNGRPKSVEVSETLVTKILLGTLGCTPAYDEFVKKGLRAVGVPYSKLSEKHLGRLWSWYGEHQPEFSAPQRDRNVRDHGLRYPPMKLVDMYLWRRGGGGRERSRIKG